MFGLSGIELVLILLFGFLIFGPEKLPSVARTVGKAIAKFREAQEQMSETLKEGGLYNPDSDEPFKNPLDVVDAVSKRIAEEGDEQNDSGEKDSGEKDSGESFAERKARYDAQQKEGDA